MSECDQPSYTIMRELNIKAETEALSDERLWERMLHKDEKAVSLLYRRYFDFLYNYGMHLSADEEIVKDCIQDLFLSFYHLHPTSPVHSVRAYILMSFRNNLLTAKRNAEQIIRMEEADFELSVPEEDFFRRFGSDDRTKKQIHKLRQAYNRLNANQRHAIYLRFIKELDWEELAEILDISAHSCMNLVGRALVKMRNLIE